MRVLHLFGLVGASLAVPSAAAEVAFGFFGADAITQSFATAGGPDYYFGPALVLDGNTFAGSPVTQATNFAGCRSGRCIGNTQSEQTFRATLGTPVAAAGAWVNGFSDAWSVRADFRDAGSTLLGSVTRTGSGFVASFIGFESDDAAIARVEFTDLAADLRVIVIDDFVTLAAAPSPVPEPQVWALLISGFTLAGTAARRRRTA